MSSSHSENSLITDRNVLICLSVLNPEIEDLKKNFCGIVLSNLEQLNLYKDPKIIVYLCGDLKEVKPINQLQNCIITEFSSNFTHLIDICRLINIEHVPLNVYNVGVYIKRLFSNQDYYNQFLNEHKFQTLSESNKPSNAYRKGIYLSKIIDKNDDSLEFNLLRCSTNLEGPTENFRETDHQLIGTVNNLARSFFKEEVEFNHVLAQVYLNKTVLNEKGQLKEKKASIKAHSDKTKDMPRNGLMAFCTFYDQSVIEDPNVLTKLRFRLKKSVTDESLNKDFSITLHPNSVFIMSLTMNRIYTHEIVPSVLPIDRIPTRIGYVIRCSKTKAVYKNGCTYINSKPLQKATEIDLKSLKDLYFRENTTTDIIEYGDVYFSMNDGDYFKPSL